MMAPLVVFSVSENIVSFALILSSKAWVSGGRELGIEREVSVSESKYLHTDSMLALVELESADGRYFQITTDGLRELAECFEGLLYSRSQKFDYG